MNSKEQAIVVFFVLYCSLFFQNVEGAPYPRCEKPFEERILLPKWLNDFSICFEKEDRVFVRNEEIPFHVYAEVNQTAYSLAIQFFHSSQSGFFEPDGIQRLEVIERRGGLDHIINLHDGDRVFGYDLEDAVNFEINCNDPPCNVPYELSDSIKFSDSGIYQYEISFETDDRKIFSHYSTTPLFRVLDSYEEATLASSLEIEKSLEITNESLSTAKENKELAQQTLKLTEEGSLWGFLGLVLTVIGLVLGFRYNLFSRLRNKKIIITQPAPEYNGTKIQTQFIEKKYLAIISIIFLFSILIAINLNLYPIEISNNVTIVVEIGVGFIIAVIIYGISRKSEAKIEDKVDSVFNILQEREKFRKEKERYIFGRLLNVFNNMETDVMQVLQDQEAYIKFEDSSQNEFYKNEIILGCKHIKILAEKNLDDSTIISPEFFDFTTIGTLKTISGVCKHEPIFSDDGNTVNVSFCNTIKNLIKPWIDNFNQKLEDEEEVPISKSPKLESDTTHLSMSVSSDRTIYPLDSNVHVRANIPSIIQGEEIVFEIFNFERKLLLSQQIDPATYDNPELKDSGIYQISFKMEGDEWKVGESYIVRATHGSSFTEDSFLIDQRMPVIQTDKSVYMVGSDMILTLIDPDADKDNQVAEYCGDREDSKLIIKSKYGKIDGYRLRETGDSTGIFQGIIGILGVRKDGSVIKQNFDGKIIDKIQGTGIDDGFIGGPPDAEITISYKNNTGITTHTVFVSDAAQT